MISYPKVDTHLQADRGRLWGLLCLPAVVLVDLRGATGSSVSDDSDSASDAGLGGLGASAGLARLTLSISNSYSDDEDCERFLRAVRKTRRGGSDSVLSACLSANFKTRALGHGVISRRLTTLVAALPSAFSIM